MHPSGRMPIRLYVPADGKPGYEDKPGSFFETKAAFSLPMQESLELFDGFWLPVPFFRYKSDSQFDRGPKNWARLRFVKLAQADANGNTHRLTLAFDTRTRARDDARDYIEPYDEDMETGALFRLAFNLHEMEWFLDEQGGLSNGWRAFSANVATILRTGKSRRRWRRRNISPITSTCSA